jgi:hypothetical protein
VDWISQEVQKLKVYWGHAATDVQFGPRGKISNAAIKSLVAKKPANKKKGIQESKDDSTRDNYNYGGTGRTDGKVGDAESVTLNCASLLFCNNRQCDWDMFTAINDSGLVYDGGLVVDEVSETYVLTGI